MRGMSEELEVLKLVAQHLNKANIIYMISGSMAANYYTVPRMTRDIDVIIELRGKDKDHFIKIFERDFWIDPDMVSAEIIRQGMFNLIHREYTVKIDFILRKNSDFQNAAFGRKQKVKIEGNTLWFISREDLILAKLLWAKDSFSALQLGDVRNLLKDISEIDQPYLEKWIKNLELEEVYGKVKI